MGCPGAGKSTVGVIVAEMLEMKYVDFDLNVLEPAWGMKVADKVALIDTFSYSTISISTSYHIPLILIITCLITSAVYQNHSVWWGVLFTKVLTFQLPIFN